MKYSNDKFVKQLHILTSTLSRRNIATFFFLLLATMACENPNPKTGLSFPSNGEFRNAQLAFPHVKEAYGKCYPLIQENLLSHSIKPDSFSLCLRVFKTEDELEICCKNKTDASFILLKTLPICAKSGTPGPKRKEGDLQVPEGFYFINHFNPLSKFYLSLGINYPNPSDLFFAGKDAPGGEIYLHGGCVTVGCVPLTDEGISELYVYAVEAASGGQKQIPVTIFPFRKGNPKKSEFGKTASPETKMLWAELEKAEQLFETDTILPDVK